MSISPGLAAASNYIPNRTSNLEFWVSSQRSPITLNGSTISQIDDLSANGYDATQATATNQPTFTSSGAINSLPTMTFDGTTDYLVSDSVASIATSSHTIISVFHGDSSISTTDRYIWSFHYNGANSGGLIINSNGIYYWNPLTSANSTLFSGDFRTQNLIITLLISNNLVVPFKNGIQGSTPASIFTANANQFSIGQEWDSTTPSNFFKGDIGEVIAFSKLLNVAERKAVEQYCAGEWKISI